MVKMSGYKQHRGGIDLHWTSAQYDREELSDGDTRVQSETGSNSSPEDSYEEIFNQTESRDGLAEKSFRTRRKDPSDPRLKNDSGTRTQAIPLQLNLPPCSIQNQLESLALKGFRKLSKDHKLASGEKRRKLNRNTDAETSHESKFSCEDFSRNAYGWGKNSGEKKRKLIISLKSPPEEGEIIPGGRDEKLCKSNFRTRLHQQHRNEKPEQFGSRGIPRGILHQKRRKKNPEPFDLRSFLQEKRRKKNPETFDLRSFLEQEHRKEKPEPCGLRSSLQQNQGKEKSEQFSRGGSQDSREQPGEALQENEADAISAHPASAVPPNRSASVSIRRPRPTRISEWNRQELLKSKSLECRRWLKLLEIKRGKMTKQPIGRHRRQKRTKSRRGLEQRDCNGVGEISKAVDPIDKKPGNGPENTRVDRSKETVNGGTFMIENFLGVLNWITS